MNINDKNGKIEMIRFVMSIIILLFHSQFLIGEDNCIFVKGSFAVEFFFLLSGYLMMASFEKESATIDESIAHRTRNMIKKFFLRLNPELFLSFVIGCAVIFLTKYRTLNGLSNIVVHSWTQPLGLMMTGIDYGDIDNVLWYTSALLISKIIIYPLLIKYKDFFSTIAAPLVGITLLGFLIQNYEHLRNPAKWIGFAYKGQIRGLGEVCLGIYSYNIAMFIRKTNLRRWVRTVLGFIEAAIYLIVVIYMTRNSTKSDAFFTVLLMIAIALSFGNSTCIDYFFQKKLFYCLGKYSFSLFLSHLYWAFGIKFMIQQVKYSSTKLLVIYVLLSMSTAFIVQLFSDWYRKNMRNKLKIILLKEQQETSLKT